MIDALIPRTTAIRRYLGVSLTTAWRREQSDPDWPKPIAIGPKLIAYKESEINAYIESRAAASACAKRARPGSTATPAAASKGVAHTDAA